MHIAHRLLYTQTERWKSMWNDDFDWNLYLLICTIYIRNYGTPRCVHEKNSAKKVSIKLAEHIHFPVFIIRVCREIACQLTTKVEANEKCSCDRPGTYDRLICWQLTGLKCIDDQPNQKRSTIAIPNTIIQNIGLTCVLGRSYKRKQIYYLAKAVNFSFMVRYALYWWVELKKMFFVCGENSRAKIAFSTHRIHFE